MKILNTDSLAETVSNFQCAVWQGLDWRNEAEDLVEWVGGRLGKRGPTVGASP